MASLDSSRPLLTRMELTTIVSNSIDIWNFHHAFSSALTALLHPSLSHLDVPNPNPPPLSALLLSHFPYLSLYTPFITAFPSSISFLSRSSAPYALYLRTQERDPRCGQLKLTDWLLSASTARPPAQDSLHARPDKDMDIGCIFSVPTHTRQPKLADLASQQTPNITTPNHGEGLPLSARPQRAPLPLLPPVWVPDAKTDACMRCARPFGLVRFTVPLLMSVSFSLPSFARIVVAVLLVILTPTISIGAGAGARIMIQEALVPKVPAPSTGSDGTDIPEQPAKLLSGVPVSIKDYRYRRLRHYCWGNRSREDYLTPRSSRNGDIIRPFWANENPYNEKFSSGASTGGGGALLAGRVIEIGTDLGGSIRLPAHCCGLYAMRSSIGRFPCQGTHAPVPELETVATTSAPMSRRLEDLEESWKRVVEMRPWEYDHTILAALTSPIGSNALASQVTQTRQRATLQLLQIQSGASFVPHSIVVSTTCVPLPWRPVNLQETKLKFGMIWEDGQPPLRCFLHSFLISLGIISPSPACRRTSEWVCDALEKQGHEVVDFAPLASQKYLCAETFLKTLIIVSDAKIMDEGSLGTSSFAWSYVSSMDIPGLDLELAIRVGPASSSKHPRCWTYTREEHHDLCPRCEDV
ncbi:amidase signature domain-containing protein [Suillus tomentosus]|nr:amidase signature domain-containing protein [Suillus tomentosus]